MSAAVKTRRPCGKKLPARAPNRLGEPSDIAGLVLSATCRAHEASAVLSAILESLCSDAAHGGAVLAQIAADALETIPETDVEEDDCNTANNALCVAVAVLTTVAHQGDNIALWAAISLLETSQHQIGQATSMILEERRT